MKLYVIENKYGYAKVAFLNKTRAEANAAIYEYASGFEHTVTEVELPFVGRSVCYVRADCGIEYNSDGTCMGVNIRKSKIYACMEHAKKDSLWLLALAYTSLHKESKFHTSSNMIASDRVGEPFGWGNYDGFDVQIIRIRVYKK